MAKTIGFLAIDFTMSCVTVPAAESPKNASAPLSASARLRALVSTANADFHWFMPSLRPR